MVVVTLCMLGVQCGDKVSVFVDVEGRCRKGRVKPFDGVKLHIGNGRAELSRHDVFVSNSQTR